MSEGQQVIGGDFNTHARAWSPLDICQSTWAVDIKEWAIVQGLDLLNNPSVPIHQGDQRQRDTTIDLIWVNEAAILNNTFQDLEIDFMASLGSDHAGLWLTYHLLQATNQPPPQDWLLPYIIQNVAKDKWIEKFQTDAHMSTSTTDVTPTFISSSICTTRPHYCFYWTLLGIR